MKTENYTSIESSELKNDSRVTAAVDGDGDDGGGALY
jgi:hypothetical protein